MDDLLVKAVQTLHSGGVVAHATETCYGLAADIFNRVAIQKLYALKAMPFEKPVSVLVRDLEEAQAYGDFSTTAVRLALQHWPGPLTIIVPRKAGLPQWINHGQDTVGFRMSSNKKAKALVEAFGGPLTTTSANKTGQPPAYKVQDFHAQGLYPDAILDAGPIGQTPPSTIVKVLGEKVEILRQGDLLI